MNAVKHLITSALPYVSGVKHLGNLVGSMLPADVYARYLRSRGYEVLFICATDDHGTPAELAAADANLDVADFCRQQHDLHADIYRQFCLSFDYFGQTSSAQNKELTQHFAGKLHEHGFLVERTVEQLFSIDDDRFLPDRYVRGTCPHCGYEDAGGDQCESCTRVLEPTELVEPRSALTGSSRLELRESRHLYFDLTKLSNRLSEWLDSKELWSPLTRSIAKKWLDEGLRERCITRDLKWGVPVAQAGFEGKVFYVWFDAPIGYIAATKQWSDAAPDSRDWKSWWWDQPDVRYTQFMGKDNVPFHTIFFPATILGTEEPWKLADQIKSFNWLTYENGKFSTSQRRGVFMNDALELYPADYWRYYLIARAPESADSNFTWEEFANIVNKDLVGVIGNMVNRVASFAATRFEQQIPEGGTMGPREEALQKTLAEQLAELEQCFDLMEFRKASTALRAMWATGNVYLEDTAPWKEFKTDKDRAAVIVRTALNLCRILAIVSEPIIPECSVKIFDMLRVPADRRSWPRQDMADELSVLPPGAAFEPPTLLFEGIEKETVEALYLRFQGD